MKLRQIFSQSRVLIIIALLVISSVLFLCNLPYYYTEGFDGEEDQSSRNESTGSPGDTSTSAPATSADISNIKATPVETSTDNSSMLPPDGSTMSPNQSDGSNMPTDMPNIPMNMPGMMNTPTGDPQIKKGVFKQPHEKI
jgi:hypothetical protein